MSFFFKKERGGYSFRRSRVDTESGKRRGEIINQ